jgi:hypothetical protein
MERKTPMTTRRIEKASQPPKRESKAERLLRYEAQVISQKLGKSLDDAMEIARALKAAQDAQNQRSIRLAQKQRRVKAERHHDRLKKESMGSSKLHGLPLQGGAPGLGKRR